MPFDTPKEVRLERPPAQIRLLASNEKNSRAPVVAPFVAPSDRNRFAHFKPLRIRKITVSGFNYLPVKSMELKGADWWQYSDVPGMQPNGYALELSAKGDEESKLIFASEGVEAGEKNPLRQILQKPAHILSREEITAIYREVSDRFKEAHSEILNGKMVVVETGYFTSEGEQIYRLEFNHNPDGTQPFVGAEISFMAKPEKYKKYLAAVLASLKTIKWDERAHLAP